MGDARVLRHDEPDSTLLEVLPDHRARIPLEHLDERAYRPPPRVVPPDANRNPVPVHQLPHGARREGHVVVPVVVRNHEPEPVPVRAHHARDERNPIDQAISLSTVRDDLPVANHGLQPYAERSPLLAIQPERLDQIVERHRNTLVLEVLLDVHPAWHRMRVLPGLRFRLRIPKLPFTLFRHDRQVREYRAVRRGIPRAVDLRDPPVGLE